MSEDTLTYETAADRMDQAADALMNAPAYSEAPVSSLREEAGYLRYGDKAPIGTAEGVEQRYIAASASTQRAEILRWAKAKGVDVHDSHVFAALDCLATLQTQSD